MLRDLEPNDLRELEKFHEKSEAFFPFPEISHPLYLIKKTILDSSGKVIGAAFVRVTSEVTLIMNENESNLKRAKGIAEAFDILDSELLKAGLNDTHVFVLPETDVKYAEFLKGNFQFEDATGIALYRSSLRNG
jgi:hypothetical protein